MSKRPIPKSVREQSLSRYELNGCGDKSAMVSAALSRLQAEIELGSLQQSADLYAEVYESDRELQTLTEAALAAWPE